MNQPMEPCSRSTDSSALPAWPASVEGWVALVADTTLPVLPRTADTLARLAREPERADPRSIASALEPDPLFTAKLFAYLAHSRAGRAAADVGTIERAILMLGIGPFFRAFEGVGTVGEMPGHDPRDCRGLARVIRRSRRAASFAGAIAAWRNDLAIEEIVIAALLHDIAEVILWVLAPAAAQRIRALQLADRQLRSNIAQKRVLDFELIELQQALAARWQLPAQIAAMMNDRDGGSSRSRGVMLAVNVARHSATGWNNPALPDDFSEIGRLLSLPPAQARAVIAAPPG